MTPPPLQCRLTRVREAYPPHHQCVYICGYPSKGGKLTTLQPCSVPFVAHDTGNASPRFMRMSVAAIPSSPDLASSCGMPFAVIIQPLALPEAGEEEVPLASTSEEGPVRCARCKAYMCAFHRWTDSGRAWICALCTARNDTPPHYQAPLDGTGRRVDTAERPELWRGSVEYVAGDAYCVRPPMCVALLFLIDVSASAVASGLTASACDAARRVLSGVVGGERALVGVATFDARPHFYRFGAPDASPTMLVVADATDPLCPSPCAAGLLLPLSTRIRDLESLLDALPSMHLQSRSTESCAGAAIKAAVATLRPTGGRILCFFGGPPSTGWGAPLRARDTVPDKDPLRPCAPADRAYTKLTQEAAENQAWICILRAFNTSNAHKRVPLFRQVCVDLFLASPGCDVATLGVLCRDTGGSLYMYPAFSPQLDFSQLHNDLRWNVGRPQGMEAVARLRVGGGLAVLEYSGCFARRTPTDVDLPAIDCDKALCATLRVEERCLDGTEVVLQFAMLFSSPAGDRRIRVHTLSVPSSGSLATLFRAADLDAQLAVASRMCASEVLKGTISAAGIRERATDDAVSALHAYRRYCAANSAAGQLILPEALKLLPLFTLALSKTLGVRADGASPDERTVWALRALAMPAASVVLSVYPRLTPLAEWLANAEVSHSLAADSYELPTSTWLSAEKLDAEGVSLLEDGNEAFLHVAPRASPVLVSALFAAPLEALSSSTFLPVLNTRASAALHALLDGIRKERGAYLRLRIVRRGDPLEQSFYARLIEDRSSSGLSYVESLCLVHKRIQSKFNS